MSAEEETEWEKLIRTGQMTPFGTKMPRKPERGKPRRVMLNDTSGFEKLLADQAELLLERKKAPFRKGGRPGAPSQGPRAKSPVSLAKGRGNEGPPKAGGPLQQQQQAPRLPAKAKLHRGQQEGWEASGGRRSPEGLSVSEEEEEGEDVTPVSWEDSLKQESQHGTDEEFFPSSSEEDEGEGEVGVTRKRRIKRYKDDGNEDYYKQRLRSVQNTYLYCGRSRLWD